MLTKKKTRTNTKYQKHHKCQREKEVLFYFVKLYTLAALNAAHTSCEYLIKKMVLQTIPNQELCPLKKLVYIVERIIELIILVTFSNLNRF